MAEVTKPIKVGNYWTNLVDTVTGENVNYEQILTWYDGTPMDDSKCDGVVYRKLPASVGGGYVRKVFDNFGQLFLEKNTVDEVRSLTPTEVLLLKIGRYRGLQLNGYYTEGDTPSPIIYTPYEGVLEDDGGEVLETTGGFKLIHNFLGQFTAAYFGVNSTKSAGVNGPRIDLMIAAAARSSGRATIIFQEGGAILTTGNHSVPNNINVRMEARLRENSPGGNAGTLMTIGSTGNSTSCSHLINIDRSTTNPRPEFENRDKVGVVIRNHRMSTIEIKHASLFGVAVEFQGDGTGTIYNNVILGQFLNNYIHLLLRNVNDGWVSENIFQNGSINNDSGFDEYIKYGVYFQSDGNLRTNTNNKIIGLGFEGRNLTAVYADFARRTKFINCRWELSTPTLYPTSEMAFATENPDTSRDNEYEVGYYNPATPIRIASTGRPIIRSVIRCRDGNTKWNNKLLVTSGNMTNHLKLLSDESTGRSYVAGSPFYFVSATTGDESRIRYSGSEAAIFTYPDSVTCTGTALATRLQVQDGKIYLLKVEVDSNGGSVDVLSVAAFNSAGNRVVLNNEVNLSTNVLGAVSANYNAGVLGGSWNLTGATEGVLGVGSTVASIAIMVRGTKIKSISVFSPDISESASFYSLYDKIDLSALYKSKEVSEDYTVDWTDEVIAVDTTSDAVEITLPLTFYGKRVTVFDKGGNAAANNITISPASGSDFIDGVPSKVIDVAYGSKTFTYHRVPNNSGWIEITS